MKLFSGWCQSIKFMISQHWFRYSLGAGRQQAITWGNVDLVLCLHIASLGPNELKRFQSSNGPSWLTRWALDGVFFFFSFQIYDFLLHYGDLYLEHFLPKCTETNLQTSLWQIDADTQNGCNITFSHSCSSTCKKIVVFSFKFYWKFFPISQITKCQHPASIS